MEPAPEPAPELAPVEPAPEPEPAPVEPAPEPEPTGPMVLRRLVRPAVGRAPGPRPGGRLPSLPDARHARRRAPAVRARRG
ncbi:MAG: hypothetical protein HC936_13075 [Leptolyngbyaceae cyanobacterium SU_3_3]|nr:hypothetical protein [Leptolyngbyaceae cyanobacterium SU_3_3]